MYGAANNPRLGMIPPRPLNHPLGVPSIGQVMGSGGSYRQYLGNTSNPVFSGAPRPAQTWKPVSRPSIPETNLSMHSGFRFGIGAVAGLIGLNSVGKAWESAKYGQWGSAAAYGAMAAGGGYVAYHSFMNTPTFKQGAMTGQKILSKNAGKLGGKLTNLAGNFIK